MDLTPEQRQLIAQARQAFRTDAHYLEDALWDARELQEKGHVVRLGPTDPNLYQQLMRSRTKNQLALWHNPDQDMQLYMIPTTSGCLRWIGRISNNVPIIRRNGPEIYLRQLLYERWHGHLAPWKLTTLPGCVAMCVHPEHLVRHCPESPRTGGQAQPVMPRILAYTDVPKDPEGCWIWRGNQHSGVPQISVKSKPTNVRRWLYDFVEGIDSHPTVYAVTTQPGCDQACVNPDHLLPKNRRKKLVENRQLRAARADTSPRRPQQGPRVGEKCYGYLEVPTASS